MLQYKFWAPLQFFYVSVMFVQVYVLTALLFSHLPRDCIHIPVHVHIPPAVK